MKSALFGAIAGVVATACMTSTMTRMHQRLPARQRYALPPREIVGAASARASADRSDAASGSTAILAHFGYGAAAGAAFALQPRRSLVGGLVYGLGVWTGSYLGWIPSSGLLKPATQHPALRNLLMLSAHAVWGGGLVVVLRELEAAERSAFSRSAPGLPDAKVHKIHRRRP